MVAQINVWSEMMSIKLNITVDDCLDTEITIETDDFKKARIIADFIEFQESVEWLEDYNIVLVEDEDIVDTDEDELDIR